MVVNAIEEAVDSSYRKGGEKAAYVEGISKQVVMKDAIMFVKEWEKCLNIMF